MSRRVLCSLDDIQEGGSAAFTVSDEGSEDATTVMVIRRDGQVFVYVNVCPHWGSPLDLVPVRFLDRSGDHILCSTHGALFRITDGFCVKGPCLGASLTRPRVQVENGTISILD